MKKFHKNVRDKNELNRAPNVYDLKIATIP